MMPSSRLPKKPRSPASTAPPAARYWSSLPRDILFVVFPKLRPREIMLGADRTCKDWRRVAVDEPTLWRRVDMGTDSLRPNGGRAMVCAAIDRGAGQCQAFSGSFDHHLLLYLVRAPTLKSLHLEPLYVPNNVFNRVLNKRLRLNCRESSDYSDDGYGMVMERINDGHIRMMNELRCLELFHCKITTRGLTAILDNSPVLETLCITGFLLGCVVDEMLQEKCARVKNLTLPCEFLFES
ncbi:hypothetical protein BAE44_0019439 [Dichanthelium oligosanthes]|uniref:F-box domain-containing protein n=1 Tax=Dichanthelium oligosanthes TaxID=888268 RepID=A0A1E5V350_9POAL|nr:hypothetical protein BAE44_0019439 [Dichanthelium oligosanthes]